MEKNTLVFVPDSSNDTSVFKNFLDAGFDYQWQMDSEGNFYFPVPSSMTLDELQDIIEGSLNVSLQGHWTGVACESPEEILMDFGNISSDMDQYGVYFIPGQISRHEEMSDDEDDEEGLQSKQIQREENMTLRIMHSTPDMVRLLRKTLTEDISESHKREVESLLKSMNLPVEEI
jgi:hypothetical protein